MVSGRSRCAALVAIAVQVTFVRAEGRASRPPDAPQIHGEDSTAESLRRGDAYSHLVSAGLAVARGHGSEAAGRSARAFGGLFTGWEVCHGGGFGAGDGRNCLTDRKAARKFDFCE